MVDFSELAHSISKLWNVPIDCFVSCKNAVVWVVTLPFRLFSQALRRLGSAGNATASRVASVLEWILQLPMDIWGALMNWVARSTTAVSRGVSHRTSRMGQASTSYFSEWIRAIADLVVKSFTSMQGYWDISNDFVGEQALAFEATMRIVVDQLVSKASESRCLWRTNVQATQALMRNVASDISWKYYEANKQAAALGFYLEELLERLQQLTKTRLGL